ncbi:MAG: hypothetical protein ACPGVT_12255 [Maricaulaceae bacterium]
MTLKKTFAVSCLALIWASTAAFADVSSAPDGGGSWDAGLDGVKVEWNDDGGFKRLYSKQTQPLSFNDSRGIRKAQIIAEEKAKAAIIRFMGENVVSGRMVAEVQADLERASRKMDSEGNDKTERKIDRTVLESLTEFTGSYSSGELRGIIVLERGVDRNTSEVWVKVGISQKSMNAGQALSNALAAPSKEDSFMDSSQKSKPTDKNVTVESYQGDW